MANLPRFGDRLPRFGDQLDPLFKVEYATKYFGPETDGFVITCKKTGNFIWTGSFISTHECRQKLLEAQGGEE